MKIKMLLLSLLTISSVTFTGFDSKIHNFAHKTIGKIPTTLAILLALSVPVEMIYKTVKNAIVEDKEIYSDMKNMLEECKNNNGGINFGKVSAILQHSDGSFDMSPNLRGKIKAALAVKDTDQKTATIEEALNELRQANEQYRRTI